MGLEKTFYNVSENVGVVEVCAIVYSPTIDCPIEFPFDVGLSTSDGSAGIYSDETVTVEFRSEITVVSQLSSPVWYGMHL